MLDDPNAPPLVTQRSPATNATGVDPAATVRATFSRAMNASTITPSSFRLERPDGSTVPASVSYDGVTFAATLTPSAALSLNTTYTVRLDPSIRAANGIALGSAVSWSFTTRPPDTTAPSVSITAPQNGATVIGTVDVNANATDNDAVSGVQFKLDGAEPRRGGHRRAVHLPLGRPLGGRGQPPADRRGARPLRQHAPRPAP